VIDAYARLTIREQVQMEEKNKVVEGCHRWVKKTAYIGACLSSWPLLCCGVLHCKLTLK
jgi:hypothetical protein